MEHAWNSEVTGCSDSELVAGCRKLTAADCKLGAKLIAYIAEVDARGLYRELAYPSLFKFLADGLQMSEGQAALRMNAAKLAQRYPAIISMLAAGAVHLSALRQISQLLTDANHLELLERVRGKSKREIERLVAQLDFPSQMRKLPSSGKPVAARAQQRMPVASQLLAATGLDAGATAAATPS